MDITTGRGERGINPMRRQEEKQEYSRRRRKWLRARATLNRITRSWLVRVPRPVTTSNVRQLSALNSLSNDKRRPLTQPPFSLPSLPPSLSYQPGQKSRVETMPTSHPINLPFLSSPFTSFLISKFREIS